MTVRLALSDVAATLSPSIDQRGVQFEHDGRIMRAFPADDAAVYRELLSSPYLEGLFDAGLVRFREAEVQLEGFELVLEMDRISVVSYPTEWPVALLKDAALATVLVGRALAKRSLILHDAHPWNVLFEGPNPVYVDVGSIKSGRRISWAWHREFRRHFIGPLVAHRLGLHSLGGHLQRTHRATGAKGIWDSPVLLPWLPPSYGRLATLMNRPAAYYDALLEVVDRMPDQGGRTRWSAYQQGGGVAVGDRAAYDPKQVAVDRFLGAIGPGTVIDIGANAGWFSELAVEHGNRVIAVDTDDPTLGQLHRRALEHHLPILALKMDVMWPPGSYGLGLAFREAPERLRSDTALALAVLHHMAGRQGITFSAFAHMLDRFAAQAAIVEFIPGTDVHIRRWPIARQPWYSLDGLITAMRPYFPRVDILPSSPAPRQMALFRRRTETRWAGGRS